MPTTTRDAAVTPDEALERIAARAFSVQAAGASAEVPRPGCVGLEPELFVIQLDRAGRPIGRVPLEAEGGVLDGVDAVARSDGRFRHSLDGPPPVYDLAQGGRITFEPGGQLEHSTAIHPTGAAAMEDVECTAQALVRGFAEDERVLAACGLDLWHELASVPQQLRAPRYCAMARYFDRIGPEGAIMMRHTASLQVNLDLGEPGEAEERYALANLASPVACASFATSPKEGAQSRRALVWQRLDPTRTGFPRAFLDDEPSSSRGSDPGRQYAEFALDADVMLFFLADGSAAPGEPGFSMRRWIEAGHPQHGHPTCADLDYHMTTLFPEVRLRGFLELRACDALPTRWRAALVVFWTGLLYDERARAAGLASLGPQRRALASNWQHAAREGLRHPGLRASARELWRLALAGAERLPERFLRPQDFECARAFFDRFVAAGRSPAEELAEAHARGPAESLAWAREEARCDQLL